MSALTSERNTVLIAAGGLTIRDSDAIGEILKK